MGAEHLTWLAPAPVLVSLGTALVATLYGHRPQVQEAIGLTGAFLLLGAAVALTSLVSVHGPFTVVFGGWAAPFGIEFAVDGLSVCFVVVAAIMGVASLIFQLSDADSAPPSPTLIPLVHSFLAGAVGAFLTGDLFNLYVWLEVVLVAALGLLALGGRTRHLEAALTYFILNVMGTLLVLVGVALVYATTGHLNYSAISGAIVGLDPAALLPIVTMLVLGLLVKAGAFPVFGWLPATYHTLPAPVLALIAGLGTKVGIYALLRTQTSIFPGVAPLMSEALGWTAVATMIAGVLGAAYHWDIRRILAFHSISQVGYMLLGIAYGTAAGAQSTLVFAMHHSFIKANLFLIAALVYRMAGSYDLREIGGLQQARPYLGALFIAQALSLVGIPPFSGFWAKLLVVREGLAQGEWLWVAAALGVGALTLYSMLKIWLEAFWKPHPRSHWRPDPRHRLAPAILVASALAALTTAAGLWPEPLLRFTAAAAARLYLRP